MAILFAKDPSSMETVGDLHGDLTNLAWVIQDAAAAPQLYDRLLRTLYSDQLFHAAKDRLSKSETPEINGAIPPEAIDRAYDYFFISWAGRNGVSGTARINYQQSIRWTSKGGSGPTRFRGAVESIPSWHERLRNVAILRKDAFVILEKIEDEKGTALYIDPPYLLDTRSGDQHGSSRYVHDFTNEDHIRLAQLLLRFQRARVLVSYYASPQLEQLYPGWEQLDCSRQKHLHVQNKRGQGRQEAPEVLLVNGKIFEGQERELF
jgi:DNA adenine methylase